MLKAMKRALLILSIVFGVLGAVVLTGAVYCVGVTAGVRLDERKLSLDTTCVRLYDTDGEQIETAKRKSVSLGEVPAYVKQAFVAVEDKRFYSHHGLDYKRICKATLKNLASFSFREGASTISQQLIKNTHLSGEKTLKRKLRECKLTLQLEKRYKKDEILGLYLNSIYFGHDAFGIGDASAFYFGKDAEELTPAQAAMLAALVRSPNTYSPFKSPEKCLGRRNFVLSLMREQGYLSKEETNAAQAEPLPTTPFSHGENAYLSLVFEELAEIFPETAGLSSLRVYTCMDSSLQKDLSSISAESDVCALVLDNSAHALKALHSTCGILKRVPASTIKPLLVYAPAIEEDKICPATPILDEKTDFSGYCPDDAGGATGSYMSARYALSHSVNIPAVKLLNEMGCEKCAGYLEKLGLPVPEEDRTLALALGAMSEGFPLPALANGYAALADGGKYAPFHTVERVEDEEGRVLYRAAPSPARVFSEETAYLVNDMLKTAAKEGTAKRLRFLPFEVCAKTGTAEGKGGNTDAYTIAYTSEDTVAVWLGNQDRTPIRATGGGLPANYVLEILSNLYKENAPAPFPSCSGVEELAFDKEEYETAHRILLSDPLAPPATEERELFKGSAKPTEVCTRYSSPSIQKPTIFLKNGAVYIELCQTKYYDYDVKRENRGQIATIYSGKYQKIICDNSVRTGESYRYFVTPKFNGRAGETVELPSVRIEGGSPLPDDWWEDQREILSSVESASSTSASTSSLASSSSMKESLGLMAGKSGRNTVQQSSKGSTEVS